MLSDNYANKFIRCNLHTEPYRTKQLSGPSTLIMWKKKDQEIKPSKTKKKEGKQSNQMAKRNTIRCGD